MAGQFLGKHLIALCPVCFLFFGNEETCIGNISGTSPTMFNFVGLI